MQNKTQRASCKFDAWWCLLEIQQQPPPMYWNFLESYNPLHNCSMFGKHCNKLSTTEFLLYQFTFMLQILHRKMFKLSITTNCLVLEWSVGDGDLLRCSCISSGFVMSGKSALTILNHSSCDSRIFVRIEKSMPDPFSSCQENGELWGDCRLFSFQSLPINPLSGPPAVGPCTEPRLNASNFTR